MVDLILKKAFEAGKNVQIIYMDQNQQITQRWIKILQLGEAKIGAYCYLRKAPRLFDRSNILAAGQQCWRFVTNQGTGPRFTGKKRMLYL